MKTYSDIPPPQILHVNIYGSFTYDRKNESHPNVLERTIKPPWYNPTMEHISNQNPKQYMQKSDASQGRCTQ